MERIEYVVDQIDGDYAYLIQTDNPSAERKMVARALLPSEINEGTRLAYEMFEYTVL